MTRRVSAVSFDLFGTLLSYDVWQDGGQFLDRLARERGVPLSGVDLLARWIGESVRARSGESFVTLEDSLREGLERIFRERNIPDRVGPWMEGLLEFWRSRPLYDDVLPCMDRLPVRACIVSNVDQAHLEAILAATGLGSRVAFALSSEEAGAYKPHPRIFQLAARRFGLPPESILHVGDSLVDDVVGAKRTGFAAAWLNRRGAARPSEFPGDFALRELHELFERVAFAPQPATGGSSTAR
ncbi:MAG TPA: HAD family hydrolase [Candidatus Thermoplasmatota archaeon]|nr:HAD family hydrolase [Candidatus Thermoplasmatota archaeon]